MLYIVHIPCVRHVFVVYNSNLPYSLTNIGVYVYCFVVYFFVRVLLKMKRVGDGYYKIAEDMLFVNKYSQVES
jgi:hypothetical protein